MQTRQLEFEDFEAPWEAFPSVPRFSIGWRMGRPETQLMDWHDRYAALGKWQRREYRRKHRAPLPLWFGFYSLSSNKNLVWGLGVVATILIYFVMFFIRILAGPFAANQVKID